MKNSLKMQPELKSISLERIDFRDTFFKYTRTEISPELERSIAAIGIVQPMVLQKKRTRYRIVSGFKRCAIAKNQRLRELPAYVFPANYSKVELFKWSVSENCSLRKLHPVETSGVLKKLLNLNVSKRVLFDEFFPLLSLESSQKLLKDYLELADFHEDLLRFLSKVPVSLRRCLVFGELPPDLQAFFARTAEENSLGINFLQEIITSITEIAKREDEPVGAVLSSLKIGEILRSDSLNRQEKMENIRQVFYARLHPAIRAKSQKLAELQKSANLPDNISLLWDPEFEKPGFLLLLKIADESDIRNLPDKLCKEEIRSYLLKFMDEL